MEPNLEYLLAKGVAALRNKLKTDDRARLHKPLSIDVIQGFRVK